MNGTKVELTGRAVIEQKLLTSLEKGGCVAILAGAKELDLFLRALGSLPGRDPDRAYVLQMIRDIETLKKGAGL